MNAVPESAAGDTKLLAVFNKPETLNRLLLVKVQHLVHGGGTKAFRGV